MDVTWIGANLYQALPWVILSVTVVTAVLVIVLNIRASKAYEGVGEGGARRPAGEPGGSPECRPELREEVAGGLKATNEVLSQTLEGMGKIQQAQLEGLTKRLGELTESNQRARIVRLTFDSRVKELQEGNEKKLDEMRKTVDEKLHDTLEKRLGESFKLVSDRLEAVHRKGSGRCSISPPAWETSSES